MNNGYDVIGDIHGHAAKLEALLRELGYVANGKSWIPPQGRKAMFVGDLIDRGPEQLRVVEIVRSMIDAGHAQSTMGNHEFNAIAYATPRDDGSVGHLREHSPKNKSQHAAFLTQVGAGSAKHRELIGWFRTLPPLLDLDGIRVVHAWWHVPYAEFVNARWAPGTPMTDEFLRAASTKGTPEFRAMDGLTKGLEIQLPNGHAFLDHAGVARSEVRTKWWCEDPRSLRDVAIVEPGQEYCVPDHALPDDYLGMPATGSPVFIGHYWMTGQPERMSRKVACLDWSAAKKGPLVAYRWDGEQEIDSRNFRSAG
jgi:hypothetical protein